MEKSTFKLLFIVLALALLVLPLVTTFNEFLTRIVMKIEIYRVIQDFIVPLEAKWVTVFLRLVGIETMPTLTGIQIGKLTTLGNHVTISWNCIGWQSFILVLITLVTGLQGSYRAFSKIQTMLIGILGTFLVNIVRISLVVIISYRINPVAAIVFHDYFSTLFTIFWLFLFWWFSYNYILERRGEYQS